jgi:hypothetical protein
MTPVTMNPDQGQRYRVAAEHALEQLDWCAGYLCAIRKGRIARQLARNRTYIKRNLMREAATPLPPEKRGEA